MVDKQSLKAGKTVRHHLDTMLQGHENTDQMVTGQSGRVRDIQASRTLVMPKGIHVFRLRAI